MSSTPLASTGACPASAVGPAPSACSCANRRPDPITVSLSSYTSHASLSGEADNIAPLRAQLIAMVNDLGASVTFLT